MGNRRLGLLDWTNCYFFILYFMDFHRFCSFDLEVDPMTNS